MLEGAKLVRAVSVTDAILAASNVAESEPAWSAATTYAADDVVRGTGDQAHTLYRSLQASNTNNAVTDATWWTAIGSTNRWEMFDASPQSQTTNADEIAVTLNLPGRIDTVGLQNVDAESVHIVMTDATEGVVFDQTYSMVSSGGVIDWWRYFFEPIQRRADLTVQDLPPYAGATLDITLSDAGQMVGCGLCIVGFSFDLGGTQWSPTVGITDYSRKQADEFGNFTVVQRAYAKRANLRVLMPNGLVDAAQDLLASFRAVPALYIGSGDYGALAVYGFFRDFAIEIAYPDLSLCSIEIEGLT